MILDLFVMLDFSPIKPDVGMILWSTIFFLLFWFLVGKLAFKPIAEALKKRETDIAESLAQAQRARDEMSNLQAKNEELLKQAAEERMAILKEAKEAKSQIITEAREQAKEEARKIVTDAKIQIDNQRMAAVTDLKNQAGNMAIEIAEKLVKQQLKADEKQKSLVSQLIDEINLS